MHSAAKALMSKEELKEVIGRYPRQGLTYLPTPLERMDNLSRRLKNINIFIKREDQTGLAMGGNKARKLDFIVADALSQKAGSIITWGGMQSNWCRQAAAAARRGGLKPVLLLFRRAHLPTEYDGNLLLDSILGADIRVVDLPPGASFMELGMVQRLVDEVAQQELAAGRRPYIAPVGGTFAEGSMGAPLGAISYAAALIEMLDQAESGGFNIDRIVLATGSGSTQAGLIVAARLICPALKIVGISVCEDLDTMTQFVYRVAKEMIEHLGVQLQIKPEDVIVHEEFLRNGYGVLDPDSAAALKLLGETEGILLDPVYTCKAMAGLLELAKAEYFSPGSNVVFLHTGGTPALFPYRKQIGELIGGTIGLEK